MTKRKKEKKMYLKKTPPKKKSLELGLHLMKTTEQKLTITASHATENTTATQNNKESGIINYVLLMANNYSMKKCGTTFLVEEKYPTLYATISYLNSYLHDKDKIWQMANTKVESTLSNKILEIKNNSLKPVETVFIPNSDVFLDIKTDPKKFHKHYQNLTPIRTEQEQHLKEINTQLCNHCLILCDFQYCNECNLIYNPPLCMIYTILEEDKPISSCILELESQFNFNLNSDNDNDKNNSPSSIQNGNNNNNNSNSNANSKQYIMFSNLFKEQELK
ncbi:hypothetical protein G9A89_014396 [Geosiphon pyriformis]|nr:hypothetical protein G9A89_014396 [Geosiphon pyriformis]